MNHNMEINPLDAQEFVLRVKSLTQKKQEAYLAQLERYAAAISAGADAILVIEGLNALNGAPTYEQVSAFRRNLENVIGLLKGYTMEWPIKTSREVWTYTLKLLHRYETSDLVNGVLLPHPTAPI